MKKLLLIFPILFFSCQNSDEGVNKLIKEFYNPNQSLKAIVFIKSGNATVNNSIQVSIVGYEYVLKNDDVGNLFIADKIEKTKRTIDSIIDVEWKTRDSLYLEYSKELRLFKKKKILKHL